MPTFSVQISDKRIIFNSTVARPSTDSVPTERKGYQTYRTLFDTGAQLTMISPKAVQELGLTPIGDMDVIPASGKPIRTNSYRIRLDIPIIAEVVLPGGEVGQETDYRGKYLEVAELPYQPADYDVLLGMDFIVGAHVSILGSLFVLSS